MLAKLGVVFLGITFGSAAFLAAGAVCFLTIAQMQYRTLQARAAQTGQAIEISSQSKDLPFVSGRADLRYAQLPSH